jgi:hypothetical protein
MIIKEIEERESYLCKVDRRKVVVHFIGSINWTIHGSKWGDFIYYCEDKGCRYYKRDQCPLPLGLVAYNVFLNNVES